MTQKFLHRGFESLVARRHVLLKKILVIQCQHGLELIRLSNACFVQAFQNTI